ncbi:MAG: divalent metal cation transporter [Sandaracinus sp.]|nr:divalent metal cation transporter [Sandaracinus sp.]
MGQAVGGSVEERSFRHAIGPGILFAGAAVGVSHLVQSTRAGASYGLSLVLVILLANLVKYPAFRLGPQYAAATRTSMLEGYRRLGRAPLVLYGLVTVATMFGVQAAVTFVCAALLLALLGLQASPVLASGGLLVFCLGLLAVGSYKWLDRITKVAVAVLTVATVIATVLALGRVDWGLPWIPDVASFGRGDWLFVAALVGWMPSAIDVSLWQSLWVLARARDSKRLPSVRASLVDFHVGYGGTVVLALCFVLLGVAVLHGREVEIPAQAHAFGSLVVGLYAEMLGEWSRPLVGAAAFLVMFSTTFTVVDGFPRALAALTDRFRGPERPLDVANDTEPRLGRAYAVAAGVLFVGSMSILAFAASSLKTLVDFATTASFLTAPILASLNHAAMRDVPAEGRMSPMLRFGSLAGIVVQAAIAVGWLWLSFG